MPKDVRLPLFEFAKKQNLYHFDLDKPDDDDLIFKSKFKANWDKELDNFNGRPPDFDLSKEHTRMQFEEWLNLRYDISKFFRKMVPDQTTPTIQKAIKSVPMDTSENVQTFITEQSPGHYIPYHMDVLTTSGIQPQKVVDRGIRIIIFLTDWMPGEFMMWGTTTIQKWKAGHILAWPALKYPHASANASHHIGYRARLSGLATEETMAWLASDEIIKV
jgi:hypothetical protein|tara:strand:+ start:3984 stop:4637 length:654 start_codon:yes stop_codon:yes gene_type:complete